jgi:hypothetical protein
MEFYNDMAHLEAGPGAPAGTKREPRKAAR